MSDVLHLARTRFTRWLRGPPPPGARLVDEAECIASVLLAIVIAHLIGARNVSWAAFSGYMVMRGHVADSLLRGVLLSALTARRRWPGTRAPAARRIGWHPHALRHAAQATVALAFLPLLGALFAMRELAQGAVSIMAVMMVP